MRILAYADRWSVCPGESLDVMVSCEAPAYQASLVRIVQGDCHPQGPGYREVPVDVHLGGPFPGRHQPIHPGSYGIVDDHPLLRRLESLSVLAAVWPTSPAAGPQTILARRDAETGYGFELGLDERGAAEFRLTSGTGIATIATGRPMRERRWYLVYGGYDSQTRCITVSQMPLRPVPRLDDAGSASAASAVVPATTTAPFTIAARPAPGGGTERHFNGRIDSPRLLAGVLEGPAPATALDRAGDLPHVVAAWDFSIGIAGDRITDVSGNGLHGRLVNLPARAVSGRQWDGSELDWRRCPAHYGAIHFHDDDLYDAGWQADFRIHVPDDLPSGVYGVRLSAGGDEYYVVFCVRPPRGRTTAPVVFLVPTASYLAYANNRIGLDVPETEQVCGRLIQLTAHDLYLQQHPELGLSFYDLHSDGSPVYYSSRLRPVIDLQPKFVGKLGGVGSNIWQFNADTHILGWLDHVAQPFDVVTDEDLHREGAKLLTGYRLVITGTHPEYTSLAMLDALQPFVDGGGRLMYLGGNGFYWRIAFHPQLPGVIECRKSEDGIRAAAPEPGEYHASFSGEYTGLWRRNGRPPNLLVGVGMAAQGFDVSSPYRRTAASRDPRAAFVFAGVDGQWIGDFGLSGGGAAGIEVDTADTGRGTPPHALVLASSERHTDVYLVVPEDMLDPVPGLGGSEADSIRSDMVFFETPGGGAVFSVGSIAWAGAMAWNRYDNEVSRITTNVLHRFLDPTPFP